MKIEMVARDVRQHGEREIDPGDTFERERVRADLHHDRARAAIAHLCESLLQFVRERRRIP